MGSLLYHMFTSLSLISLSLYHLILSAVTHLKNPTSFSAKPYHPLPLNFSLFSNHTPSPNSISNSQNPNNIINTYNNPLSLRSILKRHLPLLLTLLACVLHHALLSASAPDPLFRGGSAAHRLSSLLTSATLLLFLLLSTALPSLPRPLSFALASAAFAALSAASASSASLHTSLLPSLCSSLSSLVSASSSALSASLALSPRLFAADAALSASVALQSLWSLQTGLSLHVDAFVPDGCHRLLDLPSDSPTACDLPDSRLRAASLLRLAFLLHLLFVALLVLLVYAVVARTLSVSRRTYDPLPTSSPVVIDSNHVQMKAFTNTQE